MKRVWWVVVGVALVVLGLSFVVGSAVGQTQTSNMAVVVQHERAVIGEDMEIKAKVIQGLGNSADFQNDPDLVLFADINRTSDSGQGSDDEVVCWAFGPEEWRLLVDGEDVPIACEGAPRGVDQTGSGAAKWVFEVPPPVRNDTSEGISIRSPTRNVTAMVYAEVPSDVVVGNVIRHATVQFQLVDSKDQLFAHKGVQPTDFEEFTELTALEMLLFPALTVLGIVIWSRSLDDAVRSFGALLPMVAGLLLLGFGIFVGFGEAWTGTAAFAAAMILVGIYMVIRLFMDGFAGTGEARSR